MALKAQDILATFKGKIVTKNFKKMPNLVTLAGNQTPIPLTSSLLLWLVVLLASEYLTCLGI